MAHRRLVSLTLATVVAAALAACQSPNRRLGTGTTPPGGAKVASPGTAAGGVTQIQTGKVLGADGRGAAGVLVRATLISDHGSGLVANNGAGAGVGSNAGAGVLSNNGARLRLAAVEPSSAAPIAGLVSARTDAQGRFSLSAPSGQPLGIEAVASEDLKAIKLGVTSGAGDLTLQLAPTGALAGRVTTPEAPTVTNLEGVDVFVPGTTYVAKTAADGSYAFTSLPAGDFDVVASKTGLGRGRLAAVTVRSKQSTQAPDLALSVAAAAITTISPEVGLAGTQATLRGAAFGASTGATFSVTVGGVLVTAPKRIDDATIALTIPEGIAAGPQDVVVTVDGIAGPRSRFTVRKLSAAPTVELVAGGLSGYADGPGRTARFGLASSLVVAPDGAIYVTDTYKDCVRKIVIDAAGNATVSTVAGAPASTGSGDGPGAAAGFDAPNGLALDARGVLYVADTFNGLIRAVDTTQPGFPVTTVAGTPDGLNRRSGEPPTATDMLFRPYGLALDPQGRLVVSDTVANVVRRVDLNAPGRPITTIAGTPGGRGRTNAKGPLAKFGSVGALTVAPDGTIYLCDESDCTIRQLVVGDDGLATVSVVAGSTALGHQNGPAELASFVLPGAVALDPGGTLFIGDRVDGRKGSALTPLGGLIRQLTPRRQVVPLAGGAAGGPVEGGARDVWMGDVNGMAFEPNGNLLFTHADRSASFVCRIKLFD